MKLRVAEPPRLFAIDLRTRMPFRYGIATLESLTHLIVELNLEVDGKIRRGLAAENLAPKWFTKNPNTTPQQDVDEVLSVVRAACRFATSAGVADSVYELWRRVSDEQQRWGGDQKLPPLLFNFGPTLIERAMIDAFCRAADVTFADAVRSNALGMPEPPTGVPADALPQLTVRHTVGLSDPLTDADIPAADAIDDGLPQSLESCVRAYDLTHFKIKIGGDPRVDAQRILDIATVLRDVPDVWFSLDGNESYRDVDAFRDFWNRIEFAPFVRRSLLFVEQPFRRDVAFTVGLEHWPTRPPIIIDESDGELGSLPLALTRGYAGTSFKSCKGIFKGIANANLARRSRHDSGPGIILSAEDLTTVGPVSLMQDLAVVATLGISHVERNGHHYFRGLSMFPPEVQRAVMRTHGDLYRVGRGGFPTLHIRDGRIATGSVLAAPFGYGCDVDLSLFRQLTTND